MKVIKKPSANFDDRRGVTDPSMIVIHYTGMKNGEEALKWLQAPESKVSAHYLIEENGTIYHMVDDSKRAWHAGVSYWRGASDINSASIGIELVNPGHDHGYIPFPTEQMQALTLLCQQILKKYPITFHNIVGHSDIAPDRKQDPGELFDWKALAMNDVGFWPGDGHMVPGATPLNDKTADVIRPIQHELAEIGYYIHQNGQMDHATRLAITAFQRRFRPGRVDGLLDDSTIARINLVFKAFSA